MNKIIMDGDNLKLDNYDTEIIVMKDSKLYLLDKSEDLNLKIILEDNTSLDIYDFNTHNKKTIIEVEQNNNTKFNYYHTFKIDDDYEFTYNANLLGNNNINNITISGVAIGFAHMFVDGKIKENTKGNELNENIKVLTTKGKAFISPMLHVSALDVIANHNTAISNIREEELFYLMSKGIDEDKAISLIEDGYLYGIFKNTEFYEFIK